MDSGFRTFSTQNWDPGLYSFFRISGSQSCPVFCRELVWCLTPRLELGRYCVSGLVWSIAFVEWYCCTILHFLPPQAHNHVQSNNAPFQKYLSCLNFCHNYFEILVCQPCSHVLLVKYPQVIDANFLKNMPRWAYGYQMAFNGSKS